MNRVRGKIKRVVSVPPSMIQETVIDDLISPEFSKENSRNCVSESGSKLDPSFRARYYACSKTGLCMSDGLRRIDYVLAYEISGETESSTRVSSPSANAYENQGRNEQKAAKRGEFENNLRAVGLQLEYVDALTCENTHFVLIHAPFSVLMRQAENLMIRVPVRQSDVTSQFNHGGVVNKYAEKLKTFTFDRLTQTRLEEPYYFLVPFVAAHFQCYIGHEDPDSFFDSTDRSRMVYDLLIRTRYVSSESERCRIGIERLLNNGCYTAAFPLHEKFEYSANYNAKTCTNREILYWNWATITRILKFQPLSLIRRYFGSKIGIYFAWVGFYTYCLIPASFIGVLCILYGLMTYGEDLPSSDICESRGIGSIVMCPACNYFCDFTYLNSSCLYSKLTYVFDNEVTVVFAAAMSIGATLFLEGWKRYHAELAWKWGLLDFDVDEETVRPQYQHKVKYYPTRRLNPITQRLEPYMPFKKQALHYCGSTVAVLFFLLIVIAFVVSVVIYRTILLQVLHRVDNIKPYAILLTYSTAASINLIVVLSLSYFYNYLAMKLTEWECPRTQTDFDNSYTFKVFLFQFINYYSSIFYIAFFKRNKTSVNSDDGLEYQSEVCDPAGCMVELVIQLAIIMCGKQFWNAFVEIAYPLIMNKYRSWSVNRSNKSNENNPCEQLRSVLRSDSACIPAWERDYVLNPTSQQFLFDEYLEMVIQFGFSTLFVSAFPLAPLFALLNNIIEIRIDAYKYTMTTRRPVPEQAKDIGVWYMILDLIGRAAVLVNASIIAFTSDFIPKFVYVFVYGNNDLHGYVNNSLSYFDVSSSWRKGLIPNNTMFSSENISACRYRDYREPPCTVSNSRECNNNYDYTIQWWIVLTFRLGFVFFFEHIVSAIKVLVAYAIADIPMKICVQLQRQKYLARQVRLNGLNIQEGGNIENGLNNNISGGAALQPDVHGSNGFPLQSLSSSMKYMGADTSGRSHSENSNAESDLSYKSCTYHDMTWSDATCLNTDCFYNFSSDTLE